MSEEDLELFASADALEELETDEEELTEAEIEALFNAQKQGDELQKNLTEFTDGFAMEEFSALIGTLNLQHFSPGELLVMGGKHSTPGHRCEGKNQLPPKRHWPNILLTITVLDHLRATLGKSIVISNAYRNNPYNRCVGGASASQHKRFNAIDFVTRDLSPLDVALALMSIRNSGRFLGGIGVYNTFVHIDTRGVNREFKGKKTPQSHLDRLRAARA